MCVYYNFWIEKNKEENSQVIFQKFQFYTFDQIRIYLKQMRGKFLFREVQMMNEQGITKLEYHHFATSNERRWSGHRSSLFYSYCYICLKFPW